ncbi:hypothetical protein MMPV_002833 [Pyropia vietnamensis]
MSGGMVWVGRPAAGAAAATAAVPTATPVAASFPPGNVRRGRRRWPRTAGIVALVGAAMVALVTGMATEAVATAELGEAGPSEPATADAPPPAAAAHIATDAVQSALSASAVTVGAGPPRIGAVVRTAGEPTRLSSSASVAGLPSSPTVRASCKEGCMRLDAFKATVVEWQRKMVQKQKVRWASTQPFEKLAWELSSARRCGKTAYRCFRGESPDKVLTKAFANVLLRPLLPKAKGAPLPKTGHKSSGGVYECLRCEPYNFRWGLSCCYEGCRSVGILGGSAMFIVDSCCATLGPRCREWTYRENNPAYYWGGF